MPRHQPFKKPLPRIWLMTDSRLGDGLLAAVQRLPRGSGVIFRHYELPARERILLFARIRRITVRRGHMLLVAGEQADWVFRHADGFHGKRATGYRQAPKLRSMPVHSAAEITQAHRSGADMMLLSPVYSTRSHPELRPLGPQRFRQLAKLIHPAKVIALGGMSRAHAAKWPQKTVHGWAAIDAFAIRKAKKS